MTSTNHPAHQRHVRQSQDELAAHLVPELGHAALRVLVGLLENHLLPEVMVGDSHRWVEEPGSHGGLRLMIS